METKNASEEPEQISPNVNPINIQTSSLIKAIKQNNQEELFRLLNLQKCTSGTKIIDEIDIEYGGNALHIAITFNHVNFIIPLIKAGVDVNQKNKDGCTPTYVASARGCIEAIIILKAAGANVNTSDRDGRTPVFIAAHNGHSDVITALKAIDANIIIYSVARDLNTATDFITATVKKCLTIIRNGIIKADYWRIPAITVLSRAEYASIFRKIIAAAIVVAKRVTTSRYMPKVMLTLIVGYIFSVAKRVYVNVNIPDRDGRTPVYIAAKNGHAKVIAALHAAGADVNRQA